MVYEEFYALYHYMQVHHEDNECKSMRINQVISIGV